MLAGVDERATLSNLEIARYVTIGFVLIVPPLFILQKAVGLTTTLTMSAIFTTGPIFIFLLQLVEDGNGFALGIERVDRQTDGMERCQEAPEGSEQT